MDAPAPPGGRVWFAHALRGPACLLVVFAHLFDLFPSSQAVVAPLAHFQPLTGLPSVPWRGALGFLARHGIEPGAVGVLLFFLVSGFVIPFSLEGRKGRGFFVRRFFRLYPTLWTCLLVTLAVLAVQAQFLGSPLGYGRRALGANALLASPYTRQPWVEPVLWSLAVEELFYLLAAAAAWRLRLTSPAGVLVLAAGLTATCVATRGAALASPLFWLGFNATYVVFILLGVVAHCAYRQRWGPGASVGAAAGLFGLYLLTLHHGPAAAVRSIYVPSSVVAVVAFLGVYLVREHLPYSVWLDRLSDVSYPLYLLHAINGYVLIRAGYLLTGNYYVAAVAALAASVLVATAVHLLVETPTNDLGRRLSRRRSSPAVGVGGDHLLQRRPDALELLAGQKVGEVLGDAP